MKKKAHETLQRFAGFLWSTVGHWPSWALHRLGRRRMLPLGGALSSSDPL